ncbi:hypothetical protein [Streptomyces sp. NPDC059783]|uniref:hypothetical protein n=1 Tax=Streptomyces sp. NPDC059783 TaxID=3346944 RepID=UPI0036668525
MRYPFPAGAAVVVLTAALAACGSPSQDGGAESTPRAAAAASPSPATSPAAGGGGPASAGPAAPADTGPKVPSDELTPATGSFTKKQKEYLVDRVPKGMDPAAVLQTGQETCDRLTYLVKADPDVAVGAIVTGEIANAEPAVAHLCTGHQDLVDRAAGGYADGTYEGRALRPGRYRDVSPTKACSWQVTGAGGKELVSGSSTDGGRSTLTIPVSARTFTSTGCYAWLPAKDKG